MDLGRKMKQAAIAAAVRRQWSSLSESGERVCRNLIDFGTQLQNREFSKEERERMQKELKGLLRGNDMEKVLEWMGNMFL